MSKLFVGNLSLKVTDADLQEWVESNGYPVESAHVMTDHKTGRSRGIGFVVLKRNDQLRDAIDKLND
jgi:cold-inducible RNA-binding protein